MEDILNVVYELDYKSGRLFRRVSGERRKSDITQPVDIDWRELGAE